MKSIKFSSLSPDKVEFNSQTVEGVTIRWLIKKEDGAPNFAMRYFEMQAGSSIPEHAHPWEHEIFILDGEGEVIVNGDTQKVSKDMAVFIEPNAGHAYKNTSSETLKFLCIIPHV